MKTFDIRQIINGHSQTTPGTKEAFRQAEVIMAVDLSTGREILVFGKALIEKIVRSGKARTVRMVRIAIDEETEDLERLIALVQAFKGSHDYESRTP
jgi:hypothetical protein